MHILRCPKSIKFVGVYMLNVWGDCWCFHICLMFFLTWWLFCLLTFHSCAKIATIFLVLFFPGIKRRMWPELVQGRTKWQRWFYPQELHWDEGTSVSTAAPSRPVTRGTLKHMQHNRPASYPCPSRKGSPIPVSTPHPTTFADFWFVITFARQRLFFCPFT